MRPMFAGKMSEFVAEKLPYRSVLDLIRPIAEEEGFLLVPIDASEDRFDAIGDLCRFRILLSRHAEASFITGDLLIQPYVLTTAKGENPLVTRMNEELARRFDGIHYELPPNEKAKQIDLPFQVGDLTKLHPFWVFKSEADTLRNEHAELIERINAAGGSLAA